MLASYTSHGTSLLITSALDNMKMMGRGLRRYISIIALGKLRCTHLAPPPSLEFQPTT
jgi:hypothetical protein